MIPKKVEEFLKDELIARPPTSILDGLGMTSESLHLVTQSDFALLIGLISDQSVKSSVAWNLPLKLKSRIGAKRFTPAWLATHQTDVINAIKEKPALHRFPTTIAKYICSAAKYVEDTFPENSSTFLKHYVDFEKSMKMAESITGISKKKAGLLCLIIQLDKGIQQTGIENSSALIDVHVRNFFTTYGIANKEHAIQMAADDFFRSVWPQNPALVSTVIWHLEKVKKD